MVTKIKQTGIADAAVGTAQLAGDSVTAGKIVDGAVGTAEIDADAVTASEIATGAVGTDEIANNTIGTLDIANSSIATEDIAPEARPAFTKAFISAEQTITSAGLVSTTHSLGAKPTLLQYSLICKVAELGYSINDEVEVGLGVYDGTRANAVYADATNVNVRYSNAASCFVLGQKGTGVIAQATNTSWRLKIRAYV